MGQRLSDAVRLPKTTRRLLLSCFFRTMKDRSISGWDSVTRASRLILSDAITWCLNKGMYQESTGMYEQAPTYTMLNYCIHMQIETHNALVR